MSLLAPIMRSENCDGEETKMKPPSESFLNVRVKTGPGYKTQPRVPKGTPKAGGQFAEDRRPEGGELDEFEPPTKVSKTKRNDKWTPSNIDWKRLELVMIVERSVETDDGGHEHSYPYDYPLIDSLPMQFENSTDNSIRSDILDNFDISGLDADPLNCRCGVCGHVLKYGGVLVDFESRDGVMVGFDCLATYEAVTDGMVAAQFQARRAANIAAERNNFAKFCAKHEGLTEAFESAGEHHIVSDIRFKLKKYGSISEKQIELVKKIANDVAERRAQRAASDAAAALAPDAPNGKQTVKGTVLSTRSEESNFGYQTTYITKMLVQSDEGWKVWVTVPAAISTIPVKDETGHSIGSRGLGRGDVVQFDATLERSEKDPKFAYGKRPTKATLVNQDESE